MPHPNVDSSDFEKLQLAFHDITTKFGSFENILEAFGLANMPVAQRYGILFGCLVFMGTVIAVGSLLVMGGSFERMAEQADTGKTTMETDYRARMERPMLLERLLDARERLLQNHPDRPQRKERCTKLTQMLMNIPPPKEVPTLVDDNEAKKAVNQKGLRAEVMAGYKENFVLAYRKCQDKPGGMKI
jgi:Tfp pilus assembly protein PilO